MDKKRITTKQLMMIMDWTYVTTWQFAKKHGAKNGNGMWMIPLAPVDALVQTRARKSLGEQSRLQEVSDSL